MFCRILSIILVIITFCTNVYAFENHPLKHVYGKKIDNCEIFDIHYAPSFGINRYIHFEFFCYIQNKQGELEVRVYKFYNIVYEDDLTTYEFINLIKVDKNETTRH